MKNPFSILKTNRLSAKIIIMVEVVLIISNSVFCVVSIANNQMAIRKAIRQRMLDIANCAAGSVNGNILESLTPEDEGNARYRAVYDTMAVFRDNVELEYVYSIRDEGGGRFSFIVDTDPDAPGAFGEEVMYTEALAAAAKGEAAVDTVPYTDSWGQFYSAYSPVFNSAGRVAGIIAADFSVEWFNAQMTAQTRSAVFSYCIILLVTVFVAALLSLVAVTPFVRRQEQLAWEVRRKAEENERLLMQVIANAEEKAANLQELANHDALTGIGNKTAYDAAVSSIQDQHAGLAIVDLNNLKKLNDTYGHDKGDLAIKKIAGLICKVFRHSSVFRIGGDEFAIILCGSDCDHYDRRAKAFEEELQKISRDKTLAPWERVSAALGAAFFEEGDDVNSLFKRADQAMYRRKKEMKRHLRP